MSMPSWPTGAAQAAGAEQAVRPTGQQAVAPAVPRVVRVRPTVLAPVPVEVAAPPVEAAPAHLPADTALGASAPVVGVTTVTRDRPPDERPPRAVGDVGGPLRSAAAMIGALLVLGASFAAAVTGHAPPVPAPAPVVATFHSSDRDMARFWHPG